MRMLTQTAGEFVKITDYRIEPCHSCWKCLKHDMIPANRGVHGYAYAKQEIEDDPEAMESAKKLAKRIGELARIIARPGVSEAGRTI